MGAEARLYPQFLELLLRGRYPEAEQYIATGFMAVTKGSPDRLNFNRFIQEIERQRTAFPDLGQNIKIRYLKVIGSRLVATYLMTATFTGILDESVVPTNEVHYILSQDLVTFDAEDRITTVELVTDMRFTMEQLFPSP